MSIPAILITIIFLSFISNFVYSANALSNTQMKTYVIHMDRSKMEALDASLGTSTSWHQHLMKSISISSDGDQPRPTFHYVYIRIFCGFSAKLSDQQLQILKNMDGYILAIEDKLRNLHTTHSPQFLGLQKGEGLWTPQNLASDVIIGLVDTGIWPEHQSFQDTGLSPVPSRWKGTCENYPSFKASSCNRKLIGAAVFFKGYEHDTGRRIDETIEYISPRDSEGHGTHTTSTAGGVPVFNANISGMATGTAVGMRPTARIAAYKACFEEGCADSDILAAVEQAINDGLSISIGSPPMPYFDDSTAIATFGATKNGIIVSMSAGNDGPNSYTVTNTAPWMMTVGASYTDRAFLAYIYLGNGTIFSGNSLWSGQNINNLPLVYNQTTGVNQCLNGSLTPGLVKGKIVICDRGNNPRVAKGEEVKRAGGAAMILANLRGQGEDVIDDPHVLPTVALGVSAANAVKTYTISSNNPTAGMKFKGTTYQNRAPMMAAFSSRGPSMFYPDVLKPDITAPGVNILAAYPPNISPTNLKTDKRRVLFNLMSGTSMSCPHVSGIMALLKSLHRDWSPAAIKSALMTTAYVLDSHNSPISDNNNLSTVATPFAFGSGHVDPNRASDPGLIYNISTPDYLNYLCSLKYKPKQMKLFSGSYNTCTSVSPGDLNYPSFSVSFIGGNRPKKTYKRTVTNVGRSVSYNVTVNEPEGVSVTVVPSVLTFKGKGDELSYYVTFKAKGIMPTTNAFSYGSLIWISGKKYSVRSPIAVVWN